MRQNVTSKWHQQHRRRLVFFLAVLLLISLSCNLPTTLPIDNPFEPADYVLTGVAETLAAIEIKEPLPGTDSGLEGTQAPGSITPTPTDPPTTPGDAKVYVSENTNCRTGQGTSFERLMILLKGEEAEAVGVDTSGDYWYIRRPDKLNEFCWMWAEYATPSGAYQSLPVYTQVPTPTPGFEFELIFHSNIGLCGGLYVLQYRINNTGSFTFESWGTSSTDHTGGSNPLPNQQDSFVNISGCVSAGEMANLKPGEANYVNALFTADPTGHDITVAVQICNQDGLGGTCQSMTIRHTP